MVTIRGFPNNGQPAIDWNYDTPQQCARRWKQITETGRAPDDSTALIRAYYFGPKNKPGDGPDKSWMA